MSLLEDILEKLGLRKKGEPSQIKHNPPTAGGKPGGQPAQASRPISEVDVVKKLESLSGGNDNWKVSIVELLTLLGIDSSYEARKELALELHIPPEHMKDSASMNIWLHKQVLRRIAWNGGNVPKELLD